MMFQEFYFVTFSIRKNFSKFNFVLRLLVDSLILSYTSPKIRDRIEHLPSKHLYVVVEYVVCQ